MKQEKLNIAIARAAMLSGYYTRYRWLPKSGKWSSVTYGIKPSMEASGLPALPQLPPEPVHMPLPVKPVVKPMPEPIPAPVAAPVQIHDEPTVDVPEPKALQTHEPEQTASSWITKIVGMLKSFMKR